MQSRHNIGIVLSVAAFGVVLSWLATPIFWSSLAAFPSESIYRQLTRREEISNSELDFYLLSRQEAAARWAQPKWISDVSIGLAMKAARSGSGQRMLLEQSARATQAVLSQRPFYAAAWIRLANLSLALEQPQKDAAEMLSTSFLTGAHSPRLRGAASILGLKLWQHLSLNDRRNVMTAMSAAWSERKSNHLALLQEARRQQLEGVLELALAGNPVSSAQVRRLEAHLDRQ